ncbi:unnamed protein product [Euphydryas editha]|uniref:Endonuclease-reverse transcriptase n=1 Tax=Euphydryas editha TaxID=104508 RepID=A0AAU9UW52_EUPED|nr:unnamed protein product [Euphydryas editha]
MNMEKTKVMATTYPLENPIILGSKPLEQVKKYVYLGQQIQLGRDFLTADIERRIHLGWAAFGKLRCVFQSKLPQSLKSKVFTQCLLPIMTYASETWTLTKELVVNMKDLIGAVRETLINVSRDVDGLWS